MGEDIYVAAAHALISELVITAIPVREGNMFHGLLVGNVALEVAEKHIRAAYQSKIAVDAAELNSNYLSATMCDLDRVEKRRNEAETLLSNLVEALEKTNWSSWQSTSKFWQHKEAGEAFLQNNTTAGEDGG